MTRFVNAAEPVTISCEVCLQEVHHSRTELEEVNDYVMYFCGLECYSRWRGDNAPAAEE